MAVSFIKPVSILEIERFLDTLSVSTTLDACGLESVNAVSDGRAPQVGSICFVEDISKFVPDPTVLFILPVGVSGQASIVTADPRGVFIQFLTYLKLSQNYTSLSDKATVGIHPSAHVDESAVLDAEVVVGEGAWVGSGAVIKKGTIIGRGSIIRENAVIGSPGIALYKSLSGEVFRFPHLSGVSIGSNVEIGAGVVITQGTLTPTVIGDDVVIGNLCNIGHGVHIEKKVWMSVGTLIGGNCTLEAGATLGLGVRVRDNIRVGRGASVGMGAVLTKSIAEKSHYFGNPAKPVRSIKTGPDR